MNEQTVSTFVFADLAGFTALTEAHGDAEAADLALGFADTVTPTLADHHAELVKLIGDALMLRADDPASAIRLGLALVDDRLAVDRYPAVRVGMHYGPAVRRGGDWFGGTVNVAARIAAIAGPGEVLLSEAAREAAGDVSGVRLEFRERRALRNVSEPVVLYAAMPAETRLRHVLIDPVCRMRLDDERQALRREHDGRTYFFCSDKCADRFAADPARYATVD